MPILIPSFRTSLTFSANSTLRTNLRGILVGGTVPFDYAQQPNSDNINLRSFDPVNNIVVASTSDGDPSWANKIRNCYAIGTGVGDPLLRYTPTPISTAISGTILIRIYINPTGHPEPVPPATDTTETILVNGLSTGYGIIMKYTPGTSKPLVPAKYEVFFICTNNPADTIKINVVGTTLSPSTWYHFGIKFNTVEDPLNLGVYNTYVTSYQDGAQTQNNTQFASGYISVPSGDCSLFSKALLGDPFFGRITDFSVFNAQLSERQIKTFAKVGYT